MINMPLFSQCNTFNEPGYCPAAVAAFVLAYLLGSIPFGLLLSRLAGLGDVRKIGSGNIGATNVLRTGRKDIAALTLILDMLKGTIAPIVAFFVSPFGYSILFSALGVFLGHLFPIWLRFRGGKGVATFMGLLLAPTLLVLTGDNIASLPFLGFIASWLGMAWFTGYSSLAAIIASVTATLLAQVVFGGEFALLFDFLAILLIAKHYENIRRLLKGTESKINFNKDFS
jgi:glycerol-3-phosphate acyltransferase PlsY